MGQRRSEPVRQVVFVCSGNTCRSPMAEVLAREAFATLAAPPVVASAGITATAGLPAAAHAAEAMSRRRLSLREHRSRPLDEVELFPGALVLAMEPWQAAKARGIVPRWVRVEVLSDYLARLGAPAGTRGFEDPVGQSLEAYLALAEDLEDAVRVLAAHLGRPARGDGGEGVSVQTKTLALPRLDGLQPTLESTALKLLEEAGELAEAIGKFRALSGERREHSDDAVMIQVGQELLDVAQTAITMMFVLEEQYGADVPELLREHLNKLARKGYLRRMPS